MALTDLYSKPSPTDPVSRPTPMLISICRWAFKPDPPDTSLGLPNVRKTSIVPCSRKTSSQTCYSRLKIKAHSNRPHQSDSHYRPRLQDCLCWTSLQAGPCSLGYNQAHPDGPSLQAHPRAKPAPMTPGSRIDHIALGSRSSFLVLYLKAPGL